MTSTHTHSTRPQATDTPELQQGSLTGSSAGCTHSPSQGTFESTRLLKLFYQSWYPTPSTAQSQPSSSTSTPSKQDDTKDPDSTEIKGVVALVHGLGEHSGRYCKVVKALTAAGYAVFGFDNQGHGKSEGQRGHINRWQDYRDNTHRFLQLVRRQEATAPLFLMGHSLGGLIVLDCVLRKAHSPGFKALKLQGIIVSAPPIEPVGSTVSQARILMARLLSGLFPRLSLKMGLDECALSRDQAIANQVAEDPLIHPYVTLRWGTETLKTIAWVKAHISQLKLPILLTHGEADPIVTPDGSRDIFNRIPTDDKTLTIYPGSYHEPHNDLDAEIVVTDLVNWLDDRLVEIAP